MFPRALRTVFLLLLTKIPGAFPESRVGISQEPKAGGSSVRNTPQDNARQDPVQIRGQRLKADPAGVVKWCSASEVQVWVLPLWAV